MQSLSVSLNRWLDRLCSALSLLVLPLALLLFLQWPLRDGVGAYSRQANDMAQWIFALYVTAALRHTTRQGQHLRASLLLNRYPSHWQQRLRRWGHAAAVLPFALYVAISGWPVMVRSVLGWEGFPDTANPGYFLIKCAVWLLAVLMTLQALVDACSKDKQ